MAAEDYRWPAPAKLNLFLHVTGRRVDGYHELQTLFQLLDWGDRLHIEATPDRGVRRISSHPEIPADEDLAIRAARLLQDACQCRSGARIGVRKSIPLGAGLGGGSSDAATVLLVLNRLWDCALTNPQLAALGQRLGADVPVFVHGHSAWAEGTGELLQPDRLGDRHYVLVFPGTGVSTAAVFGDPLLERGRPRVAFDLAALDTYRNDCEAVVRARYPGIRDVLLDLAAHGRPRLTGTGSCIYLAAATADQAAATASLLKSRYNVRAVRGVDRSPVLDMLPGPR